MEHVYNDREGPLQQSSLPPLPRPSLAPESVPLLNEGISLVLSRWTALQMAVQDEWGGRDSRKKANSLCELLLSWFTDAKDSLEIYDLEDLIDEHMFTDFNAELEDGSIQEVAEQLMNIYQECLQRHCTTIERLKKTIPAQSSVSQCKQVSDGGSDSDLDDVDENSGVVSDMAIDKPSPEVETASMSGAKRVPDEDGWCVVASRKKGNRQG